MNDIKERIQNRTYQTPGRARAALHRALLSKGEKASLGGLIDAWESEAEGTGQPVIGGVPVESTASTAPFAVPGAPASRNGPSGARVPRLVSGHGDVLPLTVSLNSRIRARLTLEGLSKLHAHRDRVTIPADLIASGGVWETELWQFMAVMGEASAGDDGITVDNVIEIVQFIG